MEKLQAAKTQKNKQKEKTKRIIICQPTKNIRLGQAVRMSILSNTPSTLTELKPKSEKLN